MVDIVIKVGDKVVIVECEETKILERIGALRIGRIGTVDLIKKGINGKVKAYLKYGDDENEEWIPISWLKKIAESDTELDVNHGAKLTIQFDGDNLEVECDAIMEDLTDKEVSTLYSLVEAIYDLLGV